VHRRFALALLVASAGCVFTACAGSSATVTLKTERTGTIVWKPCGSVQCAHLGVPLDRAHPDGPQIQLSLARHPASHRRLGVLFTNPGGPGASGIDFLRGFSDVFSPDIVKSFDLVSWDERGVGDSAPVHCLDNLDPFFDVDRSPDNPSEVQQNVSASQQFVDACKQHSGSELPYVSTAASARDMDAIRAAMGVDTVSFVGFSYGTFLGAEYGEQFPQHVRAMVLDGAIDPALPYDQSVIQQAQGFDHELDMFFDWCSKNSSCGFANGANPRAAYDSLARDIESEPIPAKVKGEDRTLGPAEFDLGVASALYPGESGFQDLGHALAQAAGGQGDRLVQFADDYTDRQPGGKYSNETAAQYAIGCIDGPAPPTVDAVQQVAARAAQAAPHFGATTTWLGLPCTLWPVPTPRAPVTLHAAGVPSVLVIGTTGDPATPYTWAQSLAHELQTGHLLTYEGSGHTAYGRGSECIDGTVDRYLTTLELPPDGTRCSS
jgi:pimeloyl-ACP methyl ester carboxylesterase